MNKIKVYIVDDHELVVFGIETILNLCEDIDVVGYAYNGSQILDKLIETEPDVLLLDVHLPDTSGLEIARMIQEAELSVKIIFLTSAIERNTVIQAFEYGAVGYLSKAYKSDEIQTAIRNVYNGEKYIKGEIAQLILDNFLIEKRGTNANVLFESLSEHEKEIIKYIAKGYLNKQIAGMLKLSLRTIEAHRSQIMKKLNFKSTAEIVVFAIKNDIISI